MEKISCKFQLLKEGSSEHSDENKFIQQVEQIVNEVEEEVHLDESMDSSISEGIEQVNRPKVYEKNENSKVLRPQDPVVDIQFEKQICYVDR